MRPEEEARLEEIERRLAAVEAQLAGTGASLSASRRPDADRRIACPTAKPRATFETTFGLTWLSRIAVITVVLALAFFFEWAFENHWITGPARVGLGLAGGAAALAFGERLWRGGRHRAYARALTAAGIAFLYLSFWASFGLYHLIPQAAAFALMVLATAASGGLALRYDAVAVAALGLAGGLATPLLLRAVENPWFVLGYALVLDLGATARPLVARGWRWLAALAFAGTAVLYIDQSPAPEGMRWLFTAFVLAYYGLFTISENWLAAAAARLAAGLAVVEIWMPHTGALFVAWLMALAGLPIGGRRRASAWLALAGFGGYWLAYAFSDGSAAMGMAAGANTLVFLTFLAWPVWRAGRGAAPGAADLLLVPLNAGFYFGACYALFQHGYGAAEGLFAVGVAAVQMAGARALWRRDPRGSLLAAGAAWVLLVLAAPIQFTAWRVTIAWALEGAAVAWIGRQLGERRAVAAAIAVFGLVIARLLIVDTWMFASPASYDTIANARFLAFAVAAASMWAAAWWIGTGRLAMATYTGGHAVLLWGLCLEAAGWAARHAAPGNVRSMTSLAISVVAGGYAVALVAAGAKGRSAATRALGMGIIGLVIVKLYAYDVWLLPQFYRMMAFGILGALLLVMAGLFSRQTKRRAE